MKITKRQLRNLIRESLPTFNLRVGDVVRHRHDNYMGVGTIVAKGSTRDRQILVRWDSGTTRKHDPDVLVKESVVNEYGSHVSGGFGGPVRSDVEKMLPRTVLRKYPGVISILIKRSDAEGWNTSQLAGKVKAARIRDGEHPRSFFGRMGIKW